MNLLAGSTLILYRSNIISKFPGSSDDERVIPAVSCRSVTKRYSTAVVTVLLELPSAVIVRWLTVLSVF